jgi:hypothetical protein
MGIVSDGGRESGVTTVRVLTSPEDLAAAVARAKAFERRNAYVMAERARRHEAMLARSQSRSEDAELSSLASA